MRDWLILKVNNYSFNLRSIRKLCYKLNVVNICTSD